MNPTGESYMRALMFNVMRWPLVPFWALRAAYLRVLIASAEADRLHLFRQMQQAPAQLRFYSASIDCRRVQLSDAERAMRGL